MSKEVCYKEQVAKYFMKFHSTPKFKKSMQTYLLLQL